MKLITKTLEKRFAEIGSQESSKDPLVIAKFFNPCGSQTWFATEYDPKTRICFGYVHGMAFPEWGYFSITEMENTRVALGLKIERDLYFTEKRFSKLGL